MTGFGGASASNADNLPNELVMSASPGIIVDDTDPAQPAVAVLTVVADVVAQARDPYPGC